jgi:PAS domain-containing protein
MKNPLSGEGDQIQAAPAPVRMRILSFGESVGRLSHIERIHYGIMAVVLSLLSGWLSLQAEHLGWYGPKIGLTTGAVANGVIVVILLWIGVLPVRAAKRKEDPTPNALSSDETTLEARVLERTSELTAANAALLEQMESHARTERDFREIMENSIDVICTFDAEGRFLQVSRACQRLWGYSPEELIGRPYIEMVHPEDREKTLARDQLISAEPLRPVLKIVTCGRMA